MAKRRPMAKHEPPSIRYGWKDGARLSVDPQIVGEHVAALAQQHGGAVMPETLLSAASTPGHPLHAMFEWNDQAAAQKFRLSQARELLRSLIVLQEDREPIRAYFCIEPSCYRATGDIMRDTNWTHVMLERARAELESFQRKYTVIASMLQPAFSSIDETLSPKVSGE